MRCLQAFSLILLALLTVPASAIQLLVMGGWSESIGSSDLIAGPGTDIRSPIASGGSQAVIDITDTGGAAWTLKVARQDVNWPTGVGIAVRRTSNGSGSGTISGGTGYVSVGGMEQVLCEGTGDRSNLAIQLKLEGLSVQHAPDTYGTNLVYTVETFGGQGDSIQGARAIARRFR